MFSGFRGSLPHEYIMDSGQIYRKEQMVPIGILPVRQYRFSGGRKLVMDRMYEDTAAKQRKKVSVVVPFHNGADYLEQCVEVLQRQTYPNLEILLIDDGSSDGGEEICEVLAKRYSGIRVFHMQRRGVSAARNQGMAMAEGEYVTFVDVDDRPREGMIEYLADLLEETGSDVSGCDFFAFTSWSPCHTGWEQAEHRELLQGRDWIDLGILSGDTRCWSKLYRKEILDEVQFPEGMSIGEDMLFLLELAIRGCTLSRGNYQGYGYFLNEKGAMLQTFRDSYMDQISCWEQALNIIQRTYPEFRARTAAILLTGVMLTVGKLSLLSCSERKRMLLFRNKCSMVLKEILPDKEVSGLLDRGYRMKVWMFHRLPGLYMRIYGVLRRQR